MTISLEHLDKLIEAVEAGRPVVDFRPLYAVPRPGQDWMDLKWHAVSAYNGSLDAALRLHEALLPGWRVHDFSQYSTFWAVVLNGDAPPHFFHGKAETPARSWLLAILRAVKAQEERG